MEHRRPSRAGRDDLRQRRPGSRSRRPARRPARHARRRGRSSGSIPAARSSSKYGDSARSQPDTSAPSALRDQRETAHAGAADPDEVQPATRPGRSSAAGCGVPSAARARRTARTARSQPAPPPRSRGRVGPRQRAGPRRHRCQARRRRRAAPAPPRAGAPASARRRGSRSAAPRVRHPARVGVLVVRGRVRVRNQDRGPARRRDLEHRAAGPGDHEVGGRERVGQRVEVLEQPVVRRVAQSRQALRQRRRSRGGRVMCSTTRAPRVARSASTARRRSASAPRGCRRTPARTAHRAAMPSRARARVAVGLERPRAAPGAR